MKTLCTSPQKKSLKMADHISNKEKEALAYELIDMTAWALKELNGARIPKAWKDRLKEKLEMTKQNDQLAVNINDQKDVAAEMSLQRSRLHASEGTPATFPKPEGITKHTHRLSEKYNLSDSNDAFKYEKKYKYSISSRRREQALALLETEIETANKLGFPPNTDALKAASILREEKPIHDKIRNWISAGSKVNVLRSDTQNPLLLKILTETNLLRNNATSQKATNHTSEE